MADIDDARRAKRQLLDLLAGDRRVAGVGISGSGDAFRLKVNVVSKNDCPALPAEISGVCIEVAEVGRVVPHEAQAVVARTLHA